MQISSLSTLLAVLRWPLLAGFGVFSLLGTFLFVGREQYPPSLQPIAYSHAKHIAAGMSCTDCHTGAQAQEHATLPSITTCMTCHENALTESAEEKKIREFAAAGKPLAWVQLTRVPPDVYFSHRRHVQLAGLHCGACHGPMEKLTAPPEKPFLPVSMDGCIACHEKSHARKDCNDCHR